jgi:hypothetical protein
VHLSKFECPELTNYLQYHNATITKKGIKHARLGRTTRAVRTTVILWQTTIDAAVEQGFVEQETVVQK